MGEDEWAPESPQENQQPWSQRLLSPPRPRPQGRVLLPRFATVECLLWTPRTGSCQCLHGERDSSCEGLRSQRSQSLLAWFSPDFRELKPLGPSLLPPGRVGQVGPKARILATQAGLRPEYPPENPCKGVGHTRPGTLRLAQYCGRPPAADQGPQVFPGHSASAGVGVLLKRIVRGKTRRPVRCREGFRVPGPSPGTL